MHPRCRSTTIEALSPELMKKLERRARDPVTGELRTVPGDMTYREWYGKYVEGGELTGGGESGIIKPITIEAINECASDEVLSKECKTTIYETLKSQGTLRDYDEVKIVRIPPDKDGRIEVLRTNAESSPGYPKVTLEINEAALGGMSKETVDEMFRLDNYTAAMSLEEAIIHECGHAKVLRGKTYAQYEAEDEILKGDAFTNPIKGREDKKSLKDLAGEVSEYAQKDGMECIAECHVIISRGGSIPSDLKALYDKYIS